MKKIASTLIAGAALMMGSAAMAEAHEDASAPAGPSVYVMTGTLEGMMLVGGVGPEGDMMYGGAWKEMISATTASGDTVSITAECVGMDQPGNSLFDRHFTCTMDDGEGQTGAALYGCNVTPEKSNEMSCVGSFLGKEGGVKGRRSLLTAYYWFMPDGKGKVHGSGHWVM